MDFNQKSDVEASPRYTRGDEKEYQSRKDSAGTLNPATTLKAGDVLRNAGIDGDEALKALEMEEGETIVIDEETNRRLLRKIGNFDSLAF
jgi:hypothetical protein